MGGVQRFFLRFTVVLLQMLALSATHVVPTFVQHNNSNQRIM